MTEIHCISGPGRGKKRNLWCGTHSVSQHVSSQNELIARAVASLALFTVFIIQAVLCNVIHNVSLSEPW